MTALSVSRPLRYRFARALEWLPGPWALETKRMMYRLRSVAYQGTAYSCPCCNNSFRTFAPTGVTGRRAACPFCRSVERHRLLAVYLRHNPNLLHPGTRLLHVAPEEVIARLLREETGRGYVSGDLDERRAMVYLDVTDIAYPDHTFDAVICFHVLEHVVDDRRAVRELYRVLAPGGWAIIQSPVDPSRFETFEDSSAVRPADRERLFGQRDHVRVYGRDYIDRLKEAGFLVDTYSPNELGTEIVEKYGLSSTFDQSLYVCWKPRRLLCRSARLCR